MAETQNVDLGMVDSGSNEIDRAIELYENVYASIDNASGLLDKNSLKFGDIGSSLDEKLDLLRADIKKCSSINDGVTSTIRSNAQDQYNDYMAYLESLKNDEEEL